MTPTTTTETTEELRERRDELREEVREAEQHRADVADELERGEAALRDGRKAHRDGEINAEELSARQSKVTALENALEDAEDRLASRRSELRRVRARLADRAEVDELAERLREAEDLWALWDDRRIELAETIRELAAEIVDMEIALADAAELVRDEEGLRDRLREAGVDVNLSVLIGHRDPELNVAKGWRRPGDGAAVDPGLSGSPPERTDLGDAAELVEGALRLERERRE